MFILYLSFQKLCFRARAEESSELRLGEPGVGGSHLQGMPRQAENGVWEPAQVAHVTAALKSLSKNPPRQSRVMTKMT